MRNNLINPPEPPFVMTCAVSQKKHLAFKSKVSYSQEKYFCNLEEEVIVVDRDQAEEIILFFEALRGIGFTKDEIKATDIRYNKISDFIIDCYQTILEKLKAYSATRLFDLCLFVCQKMEREEAICYLNLKQKIQLQHQQHLLSTRHTEVEMSKEVRKALKCGDKSKDTREHLQSEQLTLLDF